MASYLAYIPLDFSAIRQRVASIGRRTFSPLRWAEG
jgi:hypothetical protein